MIETTKHFLSDRGDLADLWKRHKTGYKYKVWFNSKEIKTVFIPQKDLVITAVRRNGNDRRYDQKYTVYVYKVSETELIRGKEYDQPSIVSAKQCVDRLYEQMNDTGDLVEMPVQLYHKMSASQGIPDDQIFREISVLHVRG